MKMGINGLRRFLTDLVDLRYILIKIIYFFLLASVVTVWPYLTPHQAVLGLTKYQTGIVGMVYSAVIIVVPFLGGLVGDKIGNYKITLSVITVLSGISSLLFTVVPPAKSPSSSNAVVNQTVSPLRSNSSNVTFQRDEEDIDLSVTFWTYLAVRIIYGILHGVCFTLYEGIAMAYTQKYGMDFGFQRAWGTLGAALGGFVGGYFVNGTDYSMVFYVSSGIQIFAGCLIILLRLDFKPSNEALISQIFSLVKNAEVLMFLGAMVGVGMLIGYNESFMYRYLLDLGGTNNLLGLTVTVGAPFELLQRLFVAFLVGKAGHAPLIMIGMVLFSLKFLGLSFLYDPWWSLGLEAVESVANGLVFTAGVMYCTVLFPLGTIASFSGIFGITYFGIGKLLGTAIGNEIREVVGDRTTFQVWSGVAILLAGLYCIGYTLLKRQRRLTPKEPSKESEVRGIDNLGMVYHE